MKIAVDAMGGDFAPQSIVEGAYLAAKNHGVRVVLVGDEDQVSKELSEVSDLEASDLHPPCAPCGRHA